MGNLDIDSVTYPGYFQRQLWSQEVYASNHLDRKGSFVDLPESKQ